ALGQATTAIQNAEAQMSAPATLIGNFQGNAQAFQASLASEPLLVAAAIIVIYIILGVLYESYVHPLTILSTLPSAGLGALATLMVFGFDFSLIALIGIILLIGIVKKNREIDQHTASCWSISRSMRSAIAVLRRRTPSAKPVSCASGPS